MTWDPRGHRVLLRPCQGGWPHTLMLAIEMPDEDRYTVRCVNCEVECGRLTDGQVMRIYEQNDRRIARIAERDRSATAGQLQPADALTVGEGSPERSGPEAGAPASGGVPMASSGDVTSTEETEDELCG